MIHILSRLRGRLNLKNRQLFGRKRRKDFLPSSSRAPAHALRRNSKGENLKNRTYCYKHKNIYGVLCSDLFVLTRELHLLLKTHDEVFRGAAQSLHGAPPKLLAWCCGGGVEGENLKKRIFFILLVIQKTRTKDTLRRGEG